MLNLQETKFLYQEMCDLNDLILHHPNYKTDQLLQFIQDQIDTIMMLVLKSLD